MAQVIQTPYGTTTRVTTRDLHAWQSGAALTLTTTAPEPVDYADVVDEPLNLPVSEPDPGEPGRATPMALPITVTSTTSNASFVTTSESELVTLVRSLVEAEAEVARADEAFRVAAERQKDAHDSLAGFKSQLKDRLATHLT